MFKLYHQQIPQLVIAFLSCFSFLAVAEDLYWEESNWLGVRPDDVNPDINRWSTFQKAVVTTISGSASTYEQWAPTESSNLGVVPVTTTVDGHAQVTSSTQYVQFATSTVTQGGSTSVETSMLFAPGIWSDLSDAASLACGVATRKRQFCDLSKVDTDTIAAALIGTFEKKDKLMGTIAIVGFIDLMKAGALNLPEVNIWKLKGPLPTAPPTASVIPTGWTDPIYSNEAEVVNQFVLAAQNTAPPSTVAISTTSTSLACSSTASATISADAAYTNIVQFCGQQDHLVPINPTASTSQSFPGLEQNNTLSVSWASGCTNSGPPYTLNTDDCKTYLNDTVNGCDTASNIKHGGALTAECVVYAMTPTSFIPPSPPDPTVTQLTCANTGPSAMTCDVSDVSIGAFQFCHYLAKSKVSMSGNPDNPNAPSTGAILNYCGITRQVVQLSLKPQLAYPCNPENIPVLDFSDETNEGLCRSNMNAIINQCPDTSQQQQGKSVGGAIVQNCYRYGVEVSTKLDGSQPCASDFSGL